MATKTLLELTQDVLSDMDSDEANSIDDTIEAGIVATIIKNTYFDVHAEYVRQHVKELFRLTALGDTSNPTQMKLPSDVKDIEWIQYDRVNDLTSSPAWTVIQYVTPDEFIVRTSSRDTDESNVDAVSIISNVDIHIKNDSPPNMWTTFDDEYITFDSYESDVESSLQASKSLGYGTKTPDWTHSDSATPDLPEHLFPVLLAEARARAFAFVKGDVNNPEVRRLRRRANLGATRNSHRVDGQTDWPDYGRR